MSIPKNPEENAENVSNVREKKFIVNLLKNAEERKAQVRNMFLG